MEVSILEEDTQASHSDPENPLERDQVESHSIGTSGANPLELEGCLKVISNASSTSNFDDVVEIDFLNPLMDPPVPPTLQFLDQTTP